jgi:AGZA family xanthine/uracil permease-like MFS transporter
MLERAFGLREAQTTVRTEILAGATTFLTMAYIIFVQPAVLSGALTGEPTGMDFAAVTAATCWTAALASILMGWYARYPVALAPGMGQNFFFVLSVIPAAAATGHPEPWRVGLGVIFISGLLFLLVTLAGLREYVLAAMSPSMRSAVGAGIGLFIAFIGLQNATVVLRDPGTAVRLNPDFTSPDLFVFFVGLTITGILIARGVRAGLLVGMGAALLVALLLRAWLVPAGLAADSLLVTSFEPATAIVATPPSPAKTFLAMDIRAALSLGLLPLILLVLFMDVFDTLGTLVGVGQRAGLMRNGELPRARKAFMADALATVAGAALGTSTVTSYIESAAGVEQGGRTGLTAATSGVLFLAALPFLPLVAMIGSYPPITAPALVLVGALMLRAVVDIDWDDATEGLPAFLTLVGIPFTYSIADGIALGLIAYPILKVAAGRGHEAGWVSRLLGIILIAYFVLVRSSIG